MDDIDQENVAPESAPAPATSPRPDTVLFETPTRTGRRSSGLKESSCSPLTTPAVTDAAAVASADKSRSARRRYHGYQARDEDDKYDGHGDFQICADETRTAGSPEKRIVDVMLRSVDVMSPKCSTPTTNATAIISPRTATATRGMGSGDGSGITAGESGLLPPGSAIKYGRVGDLLVASDGSPSKRSPRGGIPTIIKDSISPGPRDESTIAADEQANIDDTCFTAFSEIPNAEVTQYTKMPSGIRQMVEDHVSYNISKTCMYHIFS